jgi:hypothetical protein
MIMSGDDPTKNLDDHALLLELVGLFREFDARQGEFDARQREFDARQREMAERLIALEQKVQQRLYDTRPMWEAVQSQIVDLRAEMEKGFRRQDHKVTMFSEKVADLCACQRYGGATRKLEPKTS